MSAASSQQVQEDIAEVPNDPQMWENQFPFCDLGADANKLDGAGFPTLAHCVSLETFAFFYTSGFGAGTPLPNGGTLRHNLLRMRSAPPRASWPDEVAFLDHLLALGIDINPGMIGAGPAFISRLAASDGMILPTTHFC